MKTGGGLFQYKIKFYDDDASEVSETYEYGTSSNEAITEFFRFRGNETIVSIKQIIK